MSAIKHALAEAAMPGWIDRLWENGDEIADKERLRAVFETMLEERGIAFDEVRRFANLSGDCREFFRFSLFVKYHSTYRPGEGGCGLCSKRHWLAAWSILPGHMAEEKEIAWEVAEGFARRHPEMGFLSIPAGWWQL